VARIRQWWWWWGGAFANREAEEGFGAKNPKPSVRGSVSGAPWETAVWGSAGRWWVWVNAIEAGGLRVRQCKARGRGLGQNPKPSVGGSVSGVLCETVVWGDAGEW
jgi:hypothetical protein